MARVRNTTHRSGWSLKNTPYRSQTSRSYLHEAARSQLLSRKEAYTRSSQSNRTQCQRDNVPVCTPEDRRRARDCIDLASVGFDPDAPTELHAEKVVDNLKALVTFRVVGSADVHACLELALRVVSEERQHGDDAGGRDVKRELVLEDGELLDVFREALEEVGAVGVQFLRRLRILGDRRIGRGWLREGGCGRYAL